MYCLLYHCILPSSANFSFVLQDNTSGYPFFSASLLLFPLHQLQGGALRTCDAMKKALWATEMALSTLTLHLTVSLKIIYFLEFRPNIPDSEIQLTLFHELKTIKKNFEYKGKRYVHVTKPNLFIHKYEIQYTPNSWDTGKPALRLSGAAFEYVLKIPVHLHIFPSKFLCKVFDNRIGYL